MAAQDLEVGTLQFHRPVQLMQWIVGHAHLVDELVPRFQEGLVPGLGQQVGRFGLYAQCSEPGEHLCEREARSLGAHTRFHRTDEIADGKRGVGQPTYLGRTYERRLELGIAGLQTGVEFYGPLKMLVQ